MKKRPRYEKPGGTSFVGYSALADSHEKVKHRRKVDRMKSQAGTDQLIYGSPLLRPPVNDLEIELYSRHDVFRSSQGEYFTTLKPLPNEWKSYVIGTKPSQADVAALKKRAEQASDLIDEL
jgi:hypothetical protein